METKKRVKKTERRKKTQILVVLVRAGNNVNDKRERGVIVEGVNHLNM